MIDPTSGAPIGATPEVSVTFGGVKYTMQMGTLAAYELSLMNIEPAEIFTVSDRDRRVTSLAHILKLFRATIAHNFIQRKQPIPSPEELAMMIEIDDHALFSEISEKTIQVVFPKLAARIQAMRLQEPAPTSEPPVN